MRSFLRIISFAVLTAGLYSCRTTRYQPSPSPAMSSLAQSYIDKYGEMAVREMKRTGIPASITLAQGMLESDFGRSPLATQANNHFGIKCHNTWNGAKAYFDDETKNECFRKYKSAEDSYRDHSDYLVTTPRYKSLFSLSPTDYKGWAHGLKKAGYATNPNYANLLITNIEKFGLHVYDTGNGKRVRYRQEQTQPEQKRVTYNTGSDQYSQQGGIVLNAGQGRIKELNRIQYIIVRDGDTYESLADEFQLLRWEIAKYNELKPDQPLVPGQIIYLQPKRSRADVGNDSCTYQDGDTMYLISQKYGIKLASLYEMNSMEPGTEPAPGTRIKLR